MKSKILTTRERLDEIRVYVGASLEFERNHEIRHAFLRLCDLVEAMSDDITYLQEAEDAEMVSFGQQ